MENNKDKQSYGLESHFTEDVYFYKNVAIYGNLDFDFSKIKTLTVNNLVVLGFSSFYGPAHFYDNVDIDGNLNAGIITARIKLDVGAGGTILTTSSGNIGIANTNPTERLVVDGNTTITGNTGIGKTLTVNVDAIISGRVGIGTSTPQQKLDVAGSVKIDETIYDSTNTPGKNGYQIVRDEAGLRWIPLIAEPISGDNPIGIPTDGIFVLDNGTPLYPA